MAKDAEHYKKKILTGHFISTFEDSLIISIADLLVGSLNFKGYLICKILYTFLGIIPGDE